MADAFVWNDEVLIPATVTIKYPVKTTDPNATEREEVVHYELSRTDLVAFIAAGMDTKLIQTVTDAEGKQTEERIPFAEVSEKQADLFFTYLAKSTKGVKDAKFFKKLDIGARGMDALVSMFFKLNYIQEVISTAGNWLMLPTIREAYATPATPSEPQTQTLEA